MHNDMPEMTRLRLRCWGIIFENRSFRSDFINFLNHINISYVAQTEIINWKTFYAEGGMSYDVHRSEVAIQSRAEKALYLSNSADGWISAFSTVLERSRLSGYFFRCSIGKHMYPVYEMICWGKGVQVRHLRALKDDTGWSFVNTGQPVEFEDTGRYLRHRIADRLDEDLLLRYSSALGYDRSCLMPSLPIFHIIVR